jgi:basic membrane protein A
MKRFSFWVAVTAMVIAATAAAPLGGAAPSSSAKPSVAVLFPGLVDDNSWNEAGYMGLLKAKKTGVKTGSLENVSHEKQLEAFQNFARQGYTVVIGHGGEYMASALRAAKAFPKTHFVVVNGNKSAKNVTSIALNYADMGYISGVLAALMSKSGKLGIVAGEHIPIVDDGINGLKVGALSVNKKVKVRSTILNSWTDVAKAREASLAMLNAGVDVLWPFLDAAETGVISAAEDEGAFSVAVYHDIRKLAPKGYIGGAWSDPGAVIFSAATQPSLRNGTVRFVGAKQGAVVLAPFAKKVPASVRAKVQKAYAAIKTGKVDSLKEAKKVA